MIPAELLKRIDHKYKIIQSKRPLSSSVVKKLKEQFSLELTFNSNAIEGNKLTLKETYLVIQDGLAVKGKSLKDHLEAKIITRQSNFFMTLSNMKNDTWSVRI